MNFSSAVQAQSSNEPPVRIGTAAQFARVRAFFDNIQFNERTVCAALHIPNIAASRGLRDDHIDDASVSPSLRAAIELFMRGAAVSAGDFRAACGDETFAALIALGLVRDARHRAGAVVCPVWLYPVDGFVVASDRRDDPDGGAFSPPDGAVFPALDAGTLRLLRLLPAHRGDALDLCGGCGIGALHLARTASHAVSADITERSAHFADFNARLNGVEIERATGDLYAPVTGRSFDVIAAHPPWVPSTGDGMVFRDGGDGGEAITRRIVEGLPRHLRSGGTAVIVGLGRDTTQARYERRVRDWLGESGIDCDVILGVEKLLSIENVVGSIRKLHLKESREQADRLDAHLRALGTDKFVYGALLVRRTGAPVLDPPLRLQMASRGAAADFDRLFAWRKHRGSVDFELWMKGAKPRLVPRLEVLAPHLEVHERRLVENGAPVAGQTVLRVEDVFSAVLQVDSWVIPVIAPLTGDQTVEQTFCAAEQAGQLPADFTLRALIDLVAMLIERGFLEVDLPS
jgi:hypothetical protein